MDWKLIIAQTLNAVHKVALGMGTSVQNNYVFWLGMSIFWSTFLIAGAVWMFGDESSKGFNGCVTRCTLRVWRFIAKLARAILGERVLNFFSSVGNYIFFKANPILMCLYFVIVYGGYLLFVWKGYPHIPKGSIHLVTIPLQMLACAVSFALCSFTDPGIVTKQNPQLGVYPFDHVSFFPDNLCRTCQLPKPARSKHCRMCNRCVARFDHHCVWVNTCIGARNHRWFLLFLLVHVCFCVYAVRMNAGILLKVLKEKRLMEMRWRDPASGEVFTTTYWFAFQWLSYHHVWLWGECILAAVMGLVLLGFLCHHLWMTALNTTTNQQEKVKDAQYYLKVLTNYRKYYPDFVPTMEESKIPSDNQGQFLCSQPMVTGDVDKNMYRKSIWANFMEVFFPPSPPKSSPSPSSSSLKQKKKKQQ
eukprot:g17578.t1